MVRPVRDSAEVTRSRNEYRLSVIRQGPVGTHYSYGEVFLILVGKVGGCPVVNSKKGKGRLVSQGYKPKEARQSKKLILSNRMRCGGVGCTKARRRVWAEIDPLPTKAGEFHRAESFGGSNL